MRLMCVSIGLACLTLAACNDDVLTTRAPLIAAEDGQALPVARDGVWAAEGGCDVDRGQPLPAWRDCGGFIVRRGRVAHPDEAADGDPAMLKAARIGVEPGFQIAQDSGGNYYGYYGVDGVRLDGAGRMVALRVWRLKCGPPPPDGSRTAGGKPRYQTMEPYPGVEVEEGGCAAKGREGLIAAARASRADPKGNRSGADGYRWVRSETPADWPEAVPVRGTAEDKS
ncbi:MAG: hypothetical protein KF842_00880 [Caulobacter sp.]|nr:hypothetical protein [Caulobacter sp.]